MDFKSQISSYIAQSAQTLLLITVFIIGGVVVPIFIAPYLYDLLSIETPYQQTETLSVTISNRNAAHGDQFQVAVSSPGQPAMIEGLQYSCQFSDISLVYKRTDAGKQLPCDKKVQLPAQSHHQLQVLTNRSRMVYLPITLSVSTGETLESGSVVLATSRKNVDGRSRLSDRSTVTLEVDGNN